MYSKKNQVSFVKKAFKKFKIWSILQHIVSFVDIIDWTN